MFNESVFARLSYIVSYYAQEISFSPGLRSPYAGLIKMPKHARVEKLTQVSVSKSDGARMP